MMKRWLFENLGLKVTAVLIAFALWAYVDLKQVLDKKRLTVHLEITDMPPGVALDPATKTSISVLLIGKDVKDLEADDIDATASLKGVSSEEQDVVVHPKIEELPSGVAASTHDLKIHLIAVNEPKGGPRKKAGK